MTGQTQIAIFLCVALCAFFAFLARDFWRPARKLALWLLALNMFLMFFFGLDGTLENIDTGHFRTSRGRTLITAAESPFQYWGNIAAQFAGEFLCLALAITCSLKLIKGDTGKPTG